MRFNNRGRLAGRLTLTIVALAGLLYLIIGCSLYLQNAAMASDIKREGGMVFGNDGIFPFQRIETIAFRNATPSAELVSKWDTLPWLNKLMFYRVDVSSEHARVIANLERLEEIELIDVDISHDDFRHIESALPDTRIVAKKYQ